MSFEIQAVIFEQNSRYDSCFYRSDIIYCVTGGIFRQKYAERALEIPPWHVIFSFRRYFSCRKEEICSQFTASLPIILLQAVKAGKRRPKRKQRSRKIPPKKPLKQLERYSLTFQSLSFSITLHIRWDCSSAISRSLRTFP